ncbi:MAG: FAD-dependent oxidoreductase [Planctomycetes bacterium]|nr:FAD-dependent oxidoreductase [Planctomycetota bacterium]MBM4056780.1 FAD-dependent oxidoreductase [Planctomycetota bacterium]
MAAVARAGQSVGRRALSAWVWAGALAALVVPPARAVEILDRFDVVIAGGSTAAFAAALAAAEAGAATALIEPTDWVGGQLTSSGVPAIDEAWHSIKPADGGAPYSVSKVARLPANMTPRFLQLVQSIDPRGDCWVSRFCFCPDAFVAKHLEPLERACGDRLVVFRDTVVKKVTLSADGGRVEGLECIRRVPRPGVAARGYDRLPSVDLADWYSPADSARFTKEVLRFVPRAGKTPVFVDATEWGEVLALSGKDYLQGVEESDGALTTAPGADTCGQATVYCFAQEIHPEPVGEPDRPVRATDMGYGAYGDKPDAWTKIWTYRRIRGKGAPATGDVCLQNWGYSQKHGEGGNDYPHAYLFTSKAATAAQVADWRGGIDLAALAGAEDRAFAWHQWFRRHAPDGIAPERIALAPAVLGTAHGLAKLPYIRDTRRAIGLDGFVLKFADLSGPAARRTGTVFPDRIALGAYPADIHPVSTCSMPEYAVAAHDTLPFSIPFRALTHRDLSNLLVAGKTMAQSFLANSATRLHPIEWSTGTACGIAAAEMAKTGRTSAQLLADITALQALVKQKTPIDWTLPE